jgi:hypothetical protein
MTPDDLPCKDGYRWKRHYGDWYCVGEDGLIMNAHAAMVARCLLPLPLSLGADLSTPAEVQSYYLARPHVPCPFVFEAP